MDHLLTQAAADLQSRSEVESALNSILHDVETAHTLEQSLHQHNALHLAQTKLAALQLRYDEREALWEMERQEKERLGVILMEEIVKLSERGVREEREREKLEMKLRRRTLADKREEESAKAVADVVDVEEEAATTENVAAAEAVVQDVVVVASGTTSDVSLNVGEKELAKEYSTTATVENTKLETVDIPNNIISTQEIITEEPSSEATAQSNTLLPHDLDETSLMNIFAFLDPLDVMNFAQTNKAMFSKIDVLFGMGGGSGSSDEEVGGDDEVKTATMSAITTPVVPLVSQPPTQQPTIAVIPKATEQTSTSSSSSTVNPTSTTGTTPKTSPKLFAMASPSIPALGSSAVGAAAANPFSQMLSRFGGAVDSASSVTSSITAQTHTTPVASSAAPAPTVDTEVKLNAAMASSMASKLTPAELSIILRMREKLQKCESDAERWRLEKEDVVANLASVEAVKEFLVTRVRDTEKVVQQQKDEMKEVNRKNLADQEVIVFLDERVKKLESTVDEMKSKDASTRKEASEMATKSEKKVRVLSDMLRFEREQMAANEQEWKMAKKVLVKEVKSCRARIVALEAELQGCSQQNAQLKEGLMALSPALSPGKHVKFR